MNLLVKHLTSLFSKDHPIFFRLIVAGILLLVIFTTGGLTSAIARSGAEQIPDGEIPVREDGQWYDIPTDQVIVGYQAALLRDASFNPAGMGQMEKLRKASGVALEYHRPLNDDAHVYRLPERMTDEAMDALVERLMALPEIAYVEPDLVMTHTTVPDDPFYGNQWHYFSPVSGEYGINAPAGWDITTGSSFVVVAVIDTGITAHSEFVGRTVPGYDFIYDIYTANDGDRRDSNPSDPGDWVSVGDPCYEGSFEPSSWHGTHTAGTIGAASDNGSGVTGINWYGKILPVRVLGKCGGYTSDISDAIRWSAGLSVSNVPNNPNPARVLNLSLGGPSSTCGPTLQNAINGANAAGSTVVVSAGNSNSDASGFSPANCSGVITVAATNRSGNRTYYSNFGSTVEISAPGGDGSGYVFSTGNEGTQGPEDEAYAFMAGTSMSAPHVSGVVSLMYSINPFISPSQVLSILQSNATSFPPGSNCLIGTATCGSGIVNAGAALAAVDPPVLPLKNFLPLVMGD